MSFLFYLNILVISCSFLSWCQSCCNKCNFSQSILWHQEDDIFFLQRYVAALFSCNDMKTLNKSTDERKHIKAELILDISDHILMQTDLTGLECGLLAGRGKRSGWRWRSDRGQSVPRCHYRNTAARGGRCRRRPRLENKTASVQVGLYFRYKVPLPTSILPLLYSLVLISRMIKYVHVRTHVSVCVPRCNYVYLSLWSSILMVSVMEEWWCKRACNERPRWGGGREEQTTCWLRGQKPGAVRWISCCGGCLNQTNINTEPPALHISLLCGPVLQRIQWHLCVCSACLTCGGLHFVFKTQEWKVSIYLLAMKNNFLSFF